MNGLFVIYGLIYRLGPVFIVYVPCSLLSMRGPPPRVAKYYPQASWHHDGRRVPARASGTVAFNLNFAAAGGQPDCNGLNKHWPFDTMSRVTPLRLPVPVPTYAAVGDSPGARASESGRH